MSEKTVQASKDDQVRLVRQAQQGDMDAFSELFNRWNQPLLQYLYHTLGNGQEAEDVAQDAFLRAYQRLDQLGPPWDFKSWLYRIGTNLAMDYLQRERRYVSVDSSDEVIDMELPTGSQPVERQVEILEQQKQVWNSLGTLPTLYRQALILRELNGLSYEEIHIALDCSYENARQLVHRARLRFRDEYGFTVAVAAGAPHCRVLGDLLSAYHDGQLTPEERRRVEEHLATCEECGETQKQMRKIGALLLVLPPLNPSRGWMDKVLRRLRTQGAGPASMATVVAPPPASAPPTPPAPGGGGYGGGTGPLMWSAIIPIVLAFVGLFLIGLFLWYRFLSPPAVPTATPGIEQASHSFIKAIPSATPDITEILPSETPTPSATPTITSTPGAMMLVLLQNANCRRGPGSVYPVLTSFLEGQRLQVDGRNEDLPRWWWILIPGGSNQHCWISNSAGTPEGDPNALPVIPAPPTPTVTPKPAKPVVDLDNDGYLSDVDCNDMKDKIHPGAAETPGDGIDSNCNSKDDS
jgi:RNA polymerase sigma-70 factor, ECF subfamily